MGEAARWAFRTLGGCAKSAAWPVALWIAGVFVLAGRNGINLHFELR